MVFNCILLSLIAFTSRMSLLQFGRMCLLQFWVHTTLPHAMVTTTCCWYFIIYYCISLLNAVEIIIKAKVKYYTAIAMCVKLTSKAKQHTNHLYTQFQVSLVQLGCCRLGTKHAFNFLPFKLFLASTYYDKCSKIRQVKKLYLLYASALLW